MISDFIVGTSLKVRPIFCSSSLSDTVGFTKKEREREREEKKMTECSVCKASPAFDLISCDLTRIIDLISVLLVCKREFVRERYRAR